MFKHLLSAIVLLVLLTAPAFADVVLDFRTADASATTRPTASDSSVSILAIPGHDFFTKCSMGDRTVEVSGSLEAMPNGQFRVKIKLDSRDAGLSSITTIVELKAGEAFTLSGLQSGASTRATVLTIKPA